MQTDARPFASLSSAEKHQRWREIALVFLRLGFVAFGGPAAHIAMMEENVVQKRRWISSEDFLDLLGATNLIPGPNSTELAIHLGYHRGGILGLILAGCCFILPAMAIVLAFAVLYQRHGQVQEVAWLLYGIKPVILAVILRALYRLGKTVVKSWLSAIVVGLVIGAYFLGVGEIPLMLAAAALYMMIKNSDRLKDLRLGALMMPASVAAGAARAAEARIGLSGIFFSFLKIGSVLYGSGYVLVAFLESEFVRGGVLTMRQLLDAVAVGQFTPGPVFTTATFIGYLLGGYAGAGLATAGIFLPSFLLVFLLNPLIPKMRASKWFSAALDGVNAASLALMAAVTIRLALPSLPDIPAILIFATSFAIMTRWKVNSFWLVLAGGLMGLVTKIL